MHDSGVDAEALALLLHRLTPASDRVVERRALPRHRAADVAPVVQHVREMHDASAPRCDHLGGPQDQVVILRPVEAGSKSADLADQLAPQHGEVAGVHRRAKTFRRPVRLQEMNRLAAVDEHVGLVAVDVVDVDRRIDRRRHLLQRRRHQRVVMIQVGDELAAGDRQPIVRCRHDAAIHLPVHDADPRVVVTERCQHGTHLGPGRAIVDDAPLPVGERLRPHAVDAGQERAERRVVDGGDDRESRTDGRRC